MRLLADFVWENPEAHEGDSSWLWSRDITRAATERGHFVHWVTPTTGGDGVDDRVERLPAMLAAREAESIVPPSVYERWKSPMAPLDAVVTNNPVRALVLGQWLNTLHKGQARIPVVVMNVSVKFPGSIEAPSFGSGDMAAWALGYAVNPNVMPSRDTLERARDVVRTYCGPPLAALYDETAVVEYLGPRTSLIDEVREPKFEKFSLYYGGRFTASKGGEDAVQAYLRFVMGGRDADVIVTHVGMAERLQKVLAKYDARGLVQTHASLGFAQALGLMTRCHASMFWQSMRQFPSTPLEQMYAGLVVLIRRDEFTDEFIPEEYPFTFGSAAEAGAMLRWVYEHYDEAKAKVDWVPEFIRSRYDRDLGMLRVVDRIAGLVEAERSKTVQGYGGLESLHGVIRQAVRIVGTPATLGDVMTVLVKQRPGLVRTHTTARGLFMTDLLRLWPPDMVDTFEAPEPVFVEVA